jgi:hypothetical protein
LRLSWVIGPGEQNFLSKLRQWAQSSDALLCKMFLVFPAQLAVAADNKKFHHSAYFSLMAVILRAKGPKDLQTLVQAILRPSGSG